MTFDLFGTPMATLASGGLAVTCGIVGLVIGYMIGLREKGRG